MTNKILHGSAKQTKEETWTPITFQYVADGLGIEILTPEDFRVQVSSGGSYEFRIQGQGGLNGRLMFK